MIAGLFLLVVAGIVARGVLPVPVLWWYLGISAITFVVYAADKSAAQNGGRRTPERSLHGLALFGGWPGASLAQQWLRHKSGKQSFRAVYWLTVVLNVLALGVLAAGHGPL